MNVDLTAAEIDLLLESLSYTKRAFLEYEHYSADYRQQQVERVLRVMEKLRALRDQVDQETKDA